MSDQAMTPQFAADMIKNLVRRKDHPEHGLTPSWVEAYTLAIEALEAKPPTPSTDHDPTTCTHCAEEAERS